MPNPIELNENENENFEGQEFLGGGGNGKGSVLKGNYDNSNVNIAWFAYIIVVEVHLHPLNHHLLTQKPTDLQLPCRNNVHLSYCAE